jgi:5-formyltetrahydrofolate cyclo-ligase
MTLVLDGIDPGKRLALAQAIEANLWELPAFRDARGVAAYYAVGTQVATAPLLGRLVEGEGRRAYLPFLLSGEMHLAEWMPSQPVIQGEYVGLQPRFARRAPLQDVDAILVPGAAFDRAGRRLGEGRGLWDGLLARLPGGVARIGLAFQAQVVDKVPQEGSDQRLNFVITEDGVINADGPSEG